MLLICRPWIYFLLWVFYGTGHVPSTSPFYGLSQREGMGLLDYQTMPALRDVALDGVFCSFSDRCARPGKWCSPLGQGGMDCPSHIKSHTAGPLSPCRPGWPSCLASPIAFGLIGHIYTVRLKIIYFRYSSGLPGLNCSAYLLTYFFSLWFVQQGSYQK